MDARLKKPAAIIWQLCLLEDTRAGSRKRYKLKSSINIEKSDSCLRIAFFTYFETGVTCKYSSNVIPRLWIAVEILPT